VGADFEVEGASLALVIDIIGSMGAEVGAAKTGLDAMITGLEAVGGAFPKTAVVTFDDSAKINVVSRDPDRLRTVIYGLTTHSTPDCPKGSHAALMTAARLLGAGGGRAAADRGRRTARLPRPEGHDRGGGRRLARRLRGDAGRAGDPYAHAESDSDSGPDAGRAVRDPQRQADRRPPLREGGVAEGDRHYVLEPGLALERRLPHGRYTISVPARDRARNVQVRPARRARRL
jgi:hypothetical protein